MATLQVSPGAHLCAPRNRAATDLCGLMAGRHEWRPYKTCRVRMDAHRDLSTTLAGVRESQYAGGDGVASSKAALQRFAAGFTSGFQRTEMI